MKKTVLYCPTLDIYTKAKEMFQDSLTIKYTLNIEYLKCPIGDDEFVKEHLQGKLMELKRTTQILARMPYLHEAWTLLKYCGSSARITHLQRVLPPKQIAWFNEEYDKLIKDAYSSLLGVHDIPSWSWKIQKLPPRLGGVLLRTGLGLSATNYSQSLASATENVKIFLPDWDPEKVFQEDAWRVLEADVNAKIDPEVFIKTLCLSAATSKNKISGIEGLEVGNSSLLKITETRTQNKLFQTMTEDQKIWTMANSGETQTWSQTLPLKHLDNVLTNFEFRAIYR